MKKQISNRSKKSMSASRRRFVRRVLRPSINLTKRYIKNVFTFAVEHIGNYDPSKYEYKGGDAPIERKDSQLASNEKCKFQRLSLDFRPTGSGKGYAIRFLSVLEAVADKGLRIVIACPSLEITNDYIPEETPMRLRFIKDDPSSDKLFNPLWSTLGYTEAGSIVELHKFLTTPIIGDHNSQICITTHQTLVQCYNNDEHPEFKDAFKNVLLILDEAHHCLYHRVNGATEKWTDEDTETEENVNKLGILIEYALEHPEDNIRLHFATATFGRGDKRNVIPAKYQDKLVVYRMSFSQYLRTECKWLKGFIYNFGLYLNSPLEVLMESMKEWKKSLCFISSGDPTLKEGKVLDHLKAITQNEKVVRPPEREDGTIVIMRNGKELVGIILVDKDGRKDKYDYIKRAHEGKEPLDFVISLRCFVEGANLKTLERMYLIGHKTSAVNIQQCIGRLTRDYKDKEMVEIIHVLPEPYIFNREKNTEEWTLERYGDYLKNIAVLLDQLDVYYSSASLPKRPSPKPDNDEDNDEPTNLLMEEIGNNGTYDTINKNLMVALVNGAMSGVPSADWLPDFKMEAKDILTEKGVVEDKVEAIIDDYLVRMKKRTQKIIDGNIGSIDPEILREIKLISGYEYVAGLIFISSNQVDVKLLEMIQECLKKKFDEAWAEVKQMVESGGITIPESMEDEI